MSINTYRRLSIVAFLATLALIYCIVTVNILVFCVAHCSYNTVKFLLDAGVSPNQTYTIKSASFHGDAYYGSALSRAADKRDLQLVKLLMDYGATLRAGQPGYIGIRNPFVSALQSYDYALIAFFIQRSSANEKAQLIHYGLRFSLEQSSEQTVPYTENDKTCYKLSGQVHPDHLKRSNLFLYIAENFATDNQILTVLRKKQPVFNSTIIEYLVRRKIFPENDELIRPYLEYPDIINRFIAGGYTLKKLADKMPCATTRTNG